MNNTTEHNKKIAFIFLVATAFFIGLLSTPVLAADPGYGAGVIGSADFESGNYGFTDSISVNYSRGHYAT